MISSIAVNNEGTIVVCFTHYAQVFKPNGDKANILDVKAQAIAFHPENANIVALGSTEGVQLWDISTGAATSNNWDVFVGDKTKFWLRKIQFSHEKSPHILLCFSDKYSPNKAVQIWDTLSESSVGPLYQDAIFSSLSDDGTKLIYHNGEYIKIINVIDGKILLEQKMNNFKDTSISELVFDPTGNEFSLVYSEIPKIGCISIGESQSSVKSFSTINASQIGETFEGSVDSWSGLKLFYLNNDKIVSANLNTNEILVWDKKKVRVTHHVNLQHNTNSDKTYTISPDKHLLLVLSSHYEPVPFLPEDEYKNSFEVENANPSSNLTDVTNELIKSVSWPAAACAGFSEYTVLDGLALSLSKRIGIRYEIPQIPELFYGLSPSNLQPIQVIADASIRKIRITLPFMLDVYAAQKDGSLFRISRTRLTLVIIAKPSVVTFDANVAQSLELEFDNARIEGKSRTHIINPELAIQMLGHENKLIKFIETSIDQLINASGPIFSYFLESLIIDSSLPQTWNQVNEYEFIFRGFDYKPVEITTAEGKSEVGYLFLIFSVVSHNFPPQCVCRDDVSPMLQQRYSQSDIRRYFSLAFSEDALNVLAEPHRNSGFSKSHSEGGGLYYTVKTYSTTQINTLELNNEKLEAEVTVKGGGGLTAGLRIKKWGVTWLSIKDSVSLHITFKDVKTTWDVSVLSNYPATDITSIVLEPKVMIDEKNIKVELNSHIDRRLDEIVSKALDWAITQSVIVLATVIQSFAYIELVYDIYNNENHDYQVSNASSKIFNDSSLIITAQVDACIDRFMNLQSGVNI